MHQRFTARTARTARTAPRSLCAAAAGLVSAASLLSAQQPGPDSTHHDSTRALSAVIVTATRALHVIAHLPPVDGSLLYAGKKTEVIQMDSLHANLAQDVERQILGRVPGANFSETEGAGFPSNGVGFRGLDPTQSVEMNVRQNGVGIAADLYGYPETYYTPPSEALERIEVVRGAASLTFGPQFGGAINYVVRSGEPNTPATYKASLTSGSFGLVNAFASVDGGTDKLTYYGFLDGRRSDGWRPNSDYRQGAAYAALDYRATDRLRLSAEYTLFRNRIHMPGGLSDAQFAANDRASFRARNWLTSPWNVLALRSRYDFARNVRLETVLSLMASERSLVWRNEDGGPDASDIDPSTGEPMAREVESETFRHAVLESRLRVDHDVFGRPATLSSGFRGYTGALRRFEGGPGSTGADFDLNLYGGTWERALRFGTTSGSAFAEELLHVSDRLSLVPGIRYDAVRSTAQGYTDVSDRFAPRSYGRTLAGLGAEYITGASTQLYANVSQAYRPILYASLVPFGSIARVDPDLHSSYGYNADLGWRGTLADALKFDVSAFFLEYGNRVGTASRSDSTGDYLETTNVGTSHHKGLEAYGEIDPLRVVRAPAYLGSLDVFTSVAYVDARYVNGEFTGNRVEQAPRVLGRTGLTYSHGAASATFQVSHTSDSFGDANNSRIATDDAAAGYVPAYTILDFSGAVRLADARHVRFGMNNLANSRYFTKRTGEYPGPGILPGMGRSVYLGVEASF